MSATTAERFRDCFEHQRFTELAELYKEDATFELLVGDFQEQRKGREAIVARYTDDYDPPPTFLHWEARTAPWGAVVQGDAVQGQGRHRARYRWVHVLTIEDDLIVNDTVYCTGMVPCPEIDNLITAAAAAAATRPASAR